MSRCKENYANVTVRKLATLSGTDSRSVGRERERETRVEKSTLQFLSPFLCLCIPVADKVRKRTYPTIVSSLPFGSNSQTRRMLSINRRAFPFSLDVSRLFRDT